MSIARKIVFALAVATLIGVPTLVYAADNCTGWMQQPDGTEWRTCTDSEGKQYCQQRNRDGSITKVSCK